MFLPWTTESRYGVSSPLQNHESRHIRCAVLAIWTILDGGASSLNSDIVAKRYEKINNFTKIY